MITGEMKNLFSHFSALLEFSVSSAKFIVHCMFSHIFTLKFYLFEVSAESSAQHLKHCE